MAKRPFVYRDMWGRLVPMYLLILFSYRYNAVGAIGYCSGHWSFVDIECLLLFIYYKQSEVEREDYY